MDKLYSGVEWLIKHSLLSALFQFTLIGGIFSVVRTMPEAILLIILLATLLNYKYIEGRIDNETSEKELFEHFDKLVDEKINEMMIDPYAN